MERYLLIFLLICLPVFAQSNIAEDSVHVICQPSAFTIGAELVTDGDMSSFDNWTQGTWTGGTGDAQEDNAGGDSDITQNITSLTDGRVYRIQFEVISYFDGNVTAVFDGVELGDKTAVGVYTGYAPAVGTNADIDIRADATFTGTIDNVSVVAWVGDPDAAGGFTIDSFTGDLFDYMGPEGQVLHHDTGLAMINDGGLLNISSGGLWDTSPQVGGLVKCVFSTTFTNGIYEIVAVTAETITIDLSSAGLGAQTVEVWIGGAFPDIGTAINDPSTLSEDINGKYRKRSICVNVPMVVDAKTVFVAESDEEDLREDDGSRELIAFYDTISVFTAHISYRVVSDCDEGQIYYAGARRAFNLDESFPEINPNGKWVNWDANGNDFGATGVVVLNSSNVKLRNFHIFNTIADAGTEGLIHIDTANFNTSFINCWFSDSSRLIVDDLVATGNVMMDCYFSDSLDVVDFVDIPSTSLVNCIVNLGAKTNGLANANSCTFLSTTIYGGTIGLNSPINCSVINGILFDQTTSCVFIDDNGQRLNVFYNTIFSPAAAEDSAISIVNGSLGPGFNNIMYATSVSPNGVMSDPVKHSQVSPNPPIPVGTIEEDPMFLDSNNGDFRVYANSPALNGGLRNVFNGWTTIGANGPYSSPKGGYRWRYRPRGHNWSDR